MSAEIWIAIITSICSLIGVIVTVFIGNSKTLYRIEQLEKKQDKHNTLIERMYKVEGYVSELQHEIKDLKK
jgi:hypothetical protein